MTTIAEPSVSTMRADATDKAPTSSNLYESLFYGPTGRQRFELTETRVEAITCIHSLVAPG